MTGELPLLFLEGFLAFISPCMLPMLPVYLMYLAAETENGKRASVVNTFGFVAGFTLIFMAMGATATSLGAILNDHRLLLQRVSGVVIMIFGLHFLGVFNIGFLDVEKKLDVKVKQSGFVGALLFGAAFSLGWTPCLGPFLGSALMLASQQGHVVEGMLMLLVYSLGLGIPFLLSAVLIGYLKSTFDWIKRHYNIINKVSGSLLVLIGLLMATGMFGRLLGLFS